MLRSCALAHTLAERAQGFRINDMLICREHQSEDRTVGGRTVIVGHIERRIACEAVVSEIAYVDFARNRFEDLPDHVRCAIV